MNSFFLSHIPNVFMASNYTPSAFTLKALHSSDILVAFLCSASSLKSYFLNVGTSLGQIVRSH